MASFARSRSARSLQMANCHMLSTLEVMKIICAGRAFAKVMNFERSCSWHRVPSLHGAGTPRLQWHVSQFDSLSCMSSALVTIYIYLIR